MKGKYFDMRLREGLWEAYDEFDTTTTFCVAVSGPACRKLAEELGYVYYGMEGW